MATVQNFNRNMIEKYLRGKDLRFLTDSDGDFVVQFGYNEDLGGELTVYLCAEGSRKDVYSIRIMSDKRIAKSDWGRAIMLCNTWNKEKRWPKAYLNVRNPDTDTRGTIEVEHHIDLEQGIHQELLDDLTNNIILGATHFWEWAHQEQGL